MGVMGEPSIGFGGSIAGGFELEQHDGGRWRLDDFRGRPVLLILHRHLM